MPCNYKDYPPNWLTEIRPAVLERAGHKCEVCGLPNYAIGYRDTSGKFIPFQEVEDALNNYGYEYFEHELKHWIYKAGNMKGVYRLPIKIILTISHKDHDIQNNDLDNLRALCQRDHLLYDQELHKASRKRNRGIIELF